MDRIIRSLTGRLTQNSSRGDFFKLLGKVALGGAALAAGGGYGVADAAACCPTPQCTGTCGGTEGTRYCCRSGGYYYGCTPCTCTNCQSPTGAGPLGSYTCYFVDGPYISCPLSPTH